MYKLKIISALYKYLILFSIILFINQFSSSQIISDYGIKAGIVTTRHRLNDASNFGFKNTFTLGIVCDFFKIKPVSLHTGIEFQNKAAIFENVYLEDKSRSDIKTTLHYISLSAAIKLQPNLKPLTFYLFTGPRLDLLTYKDESILQFAYSGLEKSNWGIICGIGFKYNMSKRYSIMLESKYDIDLSGALFSGYSTGTLYHYFSGSGRLRNESFNCSIGIIFNK